MYYDDFAMMNQSDAKMAVKYYMDEGKNALVVVLKDGRKLSFDVYNRSTRTLPPKDMPEERYRKEFGYRLWRLLQLKHISQLELSEKTGITPNMISRYICGKATPSGYNIHKIARALGCSNNELICDYDD